MPAAIQLEPGSGDLAAQLAALGFQPRCSDVIMKETVGGAVLATYGETVAGDFSVGIYYRLAATGRGELVGTAAVRVLADRVSALGSRFSLPQLDGSESGACAPRGVCGFSANLAGDCSGVVDASGRPAFARCGLVAAGDAVRVAVRLRDRYGNPSVIGQEALAAWVEHDPGSGDALFPTLQPRPIRAGLATPLSRLSAECFRLGPRFEPCNDGSCVPAGQLCSERGQEEYLQVFSAVLLAAGNHTLYAAIAAETSGPLANASLVRRERVSVASAAMHIDAGGTRVRVLFTGATNRARMGRGGSGCGALGLAAQNGAGAAVAGAAGESPVCIWRSTATLDIYLAGFSGEDMLAPGHTLLLTSDLLLTADENSEVCGQECAAVVAAPASVPVPVLRIVAPELVSGCDSFVLDTTASLNTAGVCCLA